MAAKAAAGAASSEAGGKAAETQTPAPDAAKGNEGAGKTGDQAGKTADDGAGKTKTDDQAAAGKEAQSGKKDESGKTGDDGAAAQKKAPGKYTLTVPDDAKRFVSDDLLERLEAAARENDWTQEEAAAELEAIVDGARSDYQKTIDTWEGETKGDKTYGGKNLAESQRLANSAIDKVFPKNHPMRDRFVGFLKESGGGVKLEVVAFLATLGKMMGEDTPNSGKSTGPTGDRASKFYDHPTSKAVEEQAAKG
jgi:hypothetical protein